MAVADSVEQAAADAARRFGAERYYSNYRQILEDPEVDLVDICTPNDLHASVAIEAAEAGKHIICIKPLGRTIEEAQAMVTAADKAGVLLMYAENVLFIPALTRAKEIINSGGIGDVFRVKACEGTPGPHRRWFLDKDKTGGGCVIDMAVHSLSFCRWVADSPVERIYAEIGTFVHSIPAEDTSVVTLRFKNGVIGQAEDSWSLVGAMDSRFEIFGTKGRILVDNLYSHPLRVFSDSGYALGEANVARGWSHPMPLDGSILDGHLAMLRHFVQCAMKGEAPLQSGRDGLEIMRLVCAAYESARSGRAVSLTDFE